MLVISTEWLNIKVGLRRIPELKMFKEKQTTGGPWTLNALKIQVLHDSRADNSEQTMEHLCFLIPAMMIGIFQHYTCYKKDYKINYASCTTVTDACIFIT